MSDKKLDEQTDAKAKKIVKSNMWWSMGAGLLPFPVLDWAAVTGVQLRMVKQLANHYGRSFKEDLGKSFISALIGGVLPQKLAMGPVGSLIKAVPIVGLYAGVVAVPAFAGASTYALGKVFIQHFESGGTFLDFDPAAVREHFREEFEKGKAEAASGGEDMTTAEGAKDRGDTQARRRAS